jgi:hypothetical protein
MLTKVLLCLALVAFAKADNTEWDLEESDVYGEARLLDGVFNNTSIDLNSILALVLIAILALVTLGPSLLGGGRSSQGHTDYQDYNEYYNNQQFNHRSDQIVNGE